MLEREDELDKLVEGLVESVLAEVREDQRARDARGGQTELKKIEPSSPHGIYVYDRKSRSWSLRSFDGGFKPWKDGYYVLYFDNALCPACRIHDLAWFTYVELFGRKMEGVEFVVVLCGWFARECNSSDASATFREFEVRASPTTIMVLVKNGKIQDRRELRGAKTLSELSEAISSFIKA